MTVWIFHLITFFSTISTFLEVLGKVLEFHSLHVFLVWVFYVSRYVLQPLGSLSFLFQLNHACSAVWQIMHAFLFNPSVVFSGAFPICLSLPSTYLHSYFPHRNVNITVVTH